MTLRSLTAPLACLHGFLSGVRNFLYDKGVLKIHQAPAFVISVGNLTMGGSGKTPVVAALAEVCRNKKIACAIVSRNYKASEQAISKVIIGPGSAGRFGDEPTLLAQKFPETPVYVGPRKWRTAFTASEKEKSKVLIIDDGFQHRKLHRDFDLVLIDASKSLDELQPFPWGRGREWKSALKRADLVLFTKSNGLSEVEKMKWRAILPPQTKAFFIESKIVGFIELATGKRVLPTTLLGKKAMVVSGLADPGSFTQMLKRDLQLNILDSMVFPDHHRYSGMDVDQMRQKMQILGAEILVTTEKDGVKLKALLGTGLSVEVWVAELELKCQDSLQSMHEFLADNALSQL